MSAENAKIRVLFVCLGNICRSPMAEGVFRQRVAERGLADRIEIDSAGTHAYHIDEPPDPRAQATVRRIGIDISGLRGRQARASDLKYYDYVLAMDRENLENLRALAAPGDESRIRLFLEYARVSKEREVPDPYAGGQSGFEHVLALIEDACEGLLQDIGRRFQLGAH